MVKLDRGPRDVLHSADHKFPGAGRERVEMRRSKAGGEVAALRVETADDLEMLVCDLSSNGPQFSRITTRISISMSTRTRTWAQQYQAWHKDVNIINRSFGH